MTADLHTHTTRSDGLLTPTELVQRAAAAGVRQLAITDHDTIDGLEEALSAAAGLEIEIIPGIELSTDIPGGEIHILGYFLDWQEPVFRKKLRHLQESRVGRAQQMVATLTDLGCPITFERVREIAGEASIGRPHIAQALLEAGHVQTHDEAFEKYLGRNGAAYAEREKTTPAEAIALIRGVGGVAVLAHPGEVGGISDLDALLSDLKAAGLAGIEVYYGAYPPEKRAMFLSYAERHGLIPCGGSDFHGRANSFEGITGGEFAPAASVEALRALSGLPGS